MYLWMRNSRALTVLFDRERDETPENEMSTILVFVNANWANWRVRWTKCAHCSGFMTIEDLTCSLQCCSTRIPRVRRLGAAFLSLRAHFAMRSEV